MFIYQAVYGRWPVGDINEVRSDGLKFRQRISPQHPINRKMVRKLSTSKGSYSFLTLSISKRNELYDLIYIRHVR